MRVGLILTVVAALAVQARPSSAQCHRPSDRADAYYRHGHALVQLAETGDGRWQDARAPLETAIRLDPGYGQAFGELGIVLLHLDDEGGALRAWTTAMRTSPAELQYAVMLADLYRRLMLFSQEEQVLVEALAVAGAADGHLYDLLTLLGELRENRGDFQAAVAAYEAARSSCAPAGCSDHREASFHLGVAYAEVSPPRKSEAMQSLQTFWKATCKGALAAKYGDQCYQAQEIAKRIGGSLM